MNFHYRFKILTIHHGHQAITIQYRCISYSVKFITNENWLVSPTCFDDRQPSSRRSSTVNSQILLTVCDNLHGTLKIKVTYSSRRRKLLTRRQSVTSQKKEILDYTAKKKNRNAHRPCYLTEYSTLYETPAQKCNQCGVNRRWNYIMLLHRTDFENNSTVCT